MDKDKEPPRIDQSVTSYNQTGGITANTVTMRPMPRNIDTSPGAAAFKQKLLADVTKDKPVKVLAVANDLEAHEFAAQICQFLHMNGYQVEGIGSLHAAPPIPPGVLINNPSEVMVGPAPW